jgi:hypothetical protein
MNNTRGTTKRTFGTSLEKVAAITIVGAFPFERQIDPAFPDVSVFRADIANASRVPTTMRNIPRHA